MAQYIHTAEKLDRSLSEIIESTKIVDFHTHLFTPCHGNICWWGIDELLNYHYLIAEAFRYWNMPSAKFWSLSKPEQADLIWKTLFVERTPVSEACRGVITCLSRLGADPNEKDLNKIRAFYSRFTVETFIDRIFSLANIDYVYMTNDPLDPDERTVWQIGHTDDPRFKRALRVDNFFRNAEFSLETLNNDGFPLSRELNEKDFVQVRKFFEHWCDIIAPEYIGASLPPNFQYPNPDSPYTRMMTDVVLPIAQERNLPVAMMIGVRRNVNKILKSAGDGIGKGDVQSVERLCLEYPNQPFLLTMLSRENQHEMAVASRKFRNLTLFGCWWFVNNPSLITEITAMRLELLGFSIIPQHSDCRVIDQLLYKWDHSKRLIHSVLSAKYRDLLAAGYFPEKEKMKKEVYDLLAGNVKRLINRG